ncbi:MAG TPA: sulfite exporter TauE/SafE family protein [bacterium]|nr:sulfite exporter TauE/SafE family protein [bacterium]
MEPELAPNTAFAIVLLVIAFAAAVKGALGFGFPLIAVPLSANLIGARTAVVLIAVSVVFGNLVILLRGGGRLQDARRFAGLLIGVTIGTVIGALAFDRLDPGTLALIVGITSLLFAALGLLNVAPEISPRAQSYTGPSVGLASGIMGGTTGIFAPLIAAYMHSLRLDKRGFVFWLTVSFLVGGLVQTLSYYRLGLYSGTILRYAAATFIPIIIGTQVGFLIQDRLPSETFRRLVLVLVLASGLNLVLRQLL